jgi:hypothetical protein
MILDKNLARVSMYKMAVGEIERIRHGVMLCLKTDLDNLHRRHDADSFRNTSGQTSDKDALARNSTTLVGEKLLVLFKRGESDSHFGNDAGENGSKTLVQTEGRLLCDDGGAGFDEAALRGSWLAGTP